MNLRTLEQFAQTARRQLHEQVGVRLDYVLGSDSAALRAQAATINDLKAQLKALGRDALVERVAYTWFNRFCALRFMDANGYNPVRAVSPSDGFTQPELLQEAKQGHIDPDLPVDPARVMGLLNGTVAAPDPQQEAYRLLLIAVCNSLYGPMPFLFERIADYSELLMPDDLLSTGSVLHALRAAMTTDACEDEAVLGWLYQFYIGEKKEQVDAKVKKGGKVTTDELPAKTALYTPHWIVRFLVENSLGRLWLQNRPHSQLATHMPYYIAPDPQDPTTPPPHHPKITSPEDLRLADSASGSGHMLLYAFDLLYRIYEEEGYAASEIPRLILTQNLYGMEIDPRSAALAAFALTMKARRRDRRFLRRAETAGIRPHICLLHSVHFTDQELAATPWLAALGDRLDTLPVHDALLADLHAVSLLDDVGSLLRPQLTLDQIAQVREAMVAGQSLFTQELSDRLADALDQLEYLARKYHVVVTNPPYLGKAFSDDLASFSRSNYPDSKSDMFAMFIERNLDLVIANGFNAMVTMQSWMFLSSYERLRKRLLAEATIACMVHMDNMVMGIAFGTSATVWQKCFMPDYQGDYSYIRYEDIVDIGIPFEFPVRNERLARASATDFNKIPGAPIAYWLSEQYRNAFDLFPPLKSVASIKIGMRTGDNERFLRYWHEVATADFRQRCRSATEAQQTRAKWFPYNKGGSFRKWFGNNEYVVNWGNDGYEIKSNTLLNYPQLSWNNLGWKISNEQYYFRPSLTYTATSSSYFGVRYSDEGFIFDVKGSSCFAEENELQPILGFLASSLTASLLNAVNPTIEFQTSNIGSLPFNSTLINKKSLHDCVSEMIGMSRVDWDSYETSWDFTDLPPLRAAHRAATLAATYANLRAHWQAMTDEMQRLETENNRIFIDAYGLQDELTPAVPLAEITLTCNPHYRYGGNRTPAELEELLRADTMREFISYAVGCMLGRYSLDKPGLILANAGETVEDYVGRVAGGAGRGAITFEPDADNVIPILDDAWFEDDIVGRFRRFLRVTFGEERFPENLAFIEEALGRDLRSYFLRDFYDDHVKRYQKRPIYWLFSSSHSGRGGAFNALIYMHRYRPDTVSTVLEYLRDFQQKLLARRSFLARIEQDPSAPGTEKTAALRERDKLDKALAELRQYEDEVLFPLAGEKVTIDLDDGVKVNYNRFGPALKKVTGLTQ